MSILLPQVKHPFAMLYRDLVTIVLVSPEAHLVKNPETSQSRAKSHKNPKLKMLWPLCNQTVNLETDSKSLYYSILKLK